LCPNDFWLRENVNNNSVSTTTALTQSMRSGRSKVKGKKVKISLLQAVEAHRVARGQGSHIT
jgi:hypothetical protein